MQRKFDCDQVIDIIESIINGGETLKSIARRYRVSINTIRRIVYRQTYDDCTFDKYGSIQNWNDFISKILSLNVRLGKGRGVRKW